MELSYRWRGHELSHIETVFHKIKGSHRNGQRLAGAIG
jgi:hypothetical protein